MCLADFCQIIWHWLSPRYSRLKTCVICNSEMYDVCCFDSILLFFRVMHNLSSNSAKMDKLLLFFPIQLIKHSYILAFSISFVSIWFFRIKFFIIHSDMFWFGIFWWIFFCDRIRVRIQVPFLLLFHLANSIFWDSLIFYSFLCLICKFRLYEILWSQCSWIF